MSSNTGSLESTLAQAVEGLALVGNPAAGDDSRDGQRPDDLALAFDETYTAYVANLDQLPTEPQLEALQALDAALNAMSDPALAELWTEGAVKTHPRWEEVRALAQATRAAFGWPTAP